ncbi:hypothetical protein ACWF9B_00305 [Streptomyces sp. NPDC055089]
MTRRPNAVQPGTGLTAGAFVFLLLAATAGPPFPLSLLAAALGIAAIASFGTARVRAGLPVAAVAWLGAAAVGAALAWGLGEHPLSSTMAAVAAVQAVVGAVLLPGYLRGSARAGRTASRP